MLIFIPDHSADNEISDETVTALNRAFHLEVLGDLSIRNGTAQGKIPAH